MERHQCPTEERGSWVASRSPSLCPSHLSLLLFVKFPSQLQVSNSVSPRRHTRLYSCSMFCLSKVERAGSKPHHTTSGVQRAFPFLNCTSLFPQQLSHITVLLFAILSSCPPSPTPVGRTRLLLRTQSVYLIVLDNLCTDQTVVVQNRGKEFPPSQRLLRPSSITHGLIITFSFCLATPSDVGVLD